MLEIHNPQSHPSLFKKTKGLTSLPGVWCKAEAETKDHNQTIMPVDDDKEQEILAPRACTKHACAIQVCINKHNYKEDPVGHCQKYVEAYESCVRRWKENRTGRGN